jgi:hypothetical protein
MRKTNRTDEREHQGRLRSSLKGTFNTQLQQLRLLKTATKKRRALKKGGNKFRTHEIGRDVHRNLLCWDSFSTEPAAPACQLMSALA